MEKLSPLIDSVNLTEDYSFIYFTGAWLQASFVGYGRLGLNAVNGTQARILQQTSSSHFFTWAAKT